MPHTVIINKTSSRITLPVSKPIRFSHLPALNTTASAPRSSEAAAWRRNDWQTILTLLPYLLEFKGRVAAALLCLTAAKLANVGVPLVMKEIIDSLDAKQAVLVLPFALLAIYGLLRLSTTLFAELRDIVFVRVAKRAIRRVALQVFRHLHSLSLRFHLERQTGGVSRDIERGTRGISTLLTYMLFSIIPVVIEFSLVAFVLLAKFDWRFVAITMAAVVIYLGFLGQGNTTAFSGNGQQMIFGGFELTMG